ncbi:DUF2163 domain-containing protein [Stenotrophomonas sp. PS02298]|uniref:phage BR0599 family protein n=1 Tax=Stenotrophomonas sp. PS02298 TaxID=2991424 RepID=UPI00249B833D|nr:DUF2163 domain-containing protein [Stenotrophomonas sp. PS02298]
MARNRFGAKPVHLFVFTRQHLAWRYCTADRDLVIDGKTYLSAQISRSEIRQTVERAKDKVTIKIAYLLDPSAADYPTTQSLGNNWWPHPPTDTIAVVCMTYDAGSADAPAIEWIGQIVQPKVDGSEMELTCEPGNGYAHARGQGLRWQRGCGKTVYSVGPRGCNLGTGAGARVVTGTVTKLEHVDGDVAPQAHVLVPALAGYIQSLRGRQVTWGSGQAAAVLEAYFAYTERRVMTPPGSESTEFHWEPIGDRTDHSKEIGPVVISYYYTRHAALVLSDATGLSVGSVVSVAIPAVAVTATVAAVGGLQITAPELAGSTFSLAGGFIAFNAPNGLLIRRDIADHALGGTLLTLTPGGAAPKVGDVITALPTCPRTWAACAERGNTDNYGGSIYKPIKNPMDGVSMSWG